MALNEQFVGMQVKIAADAPSYITDDRDEKLSVVGVKLYEGCTFPTYDLVGEDGRKFHLNGMFLDFIKWLSNKRPVFPVVIREEAPKALFTLPR